MKQADFAGIYDIHEARDLAEMLLSTPDRTVGFDIETGYRGPSRNGGALDPDRAFVVGFSITNSKHWARYIPLRHDMGLNLDVDAVLDAFRPVLEGLWIVAHNSSFEERFLAREGILLNIKSDTMLEAHALGRFESIGLKDLSRKVLGYEQAEITSLWPKPEKGERWHKSVRPPTNKQIRFNPLNSMRDDVVSYACDDAAVALALHEKHYPEIKDHPIYQLEMDVRLPTIDMEDRGVRLDFDFLKQGEQEVKDFLGVMEEEVKDGLADLAGVTREELSIVAQNLDEETISKLRAKGKPIPDINLNSSQQIGRVLFDHVGLSVRQKTKSGAMSTGEPALKPLGRKIPAIARFLTYKSVVKLSGSYYGKWYRDYRDHPTGRAHPSWNQTTVAAGRYGVSDPPVQQMPKKFEYESRGVVLKGNFRNSVVAAPGCYLLDYDYSQIELRVIATLANELELRGAFDRDEDPHSTTAELMGVDRDTGKTLNFALLYQMGVPALADALGVSRERAKYLRNTWFRTYSNISDWAEEMQFLGESRGYVETYFGRRVPIWEFQAASRLRAQGEMGKANSMYGNAQRLCVNAPVQGTAADYMKQAMVRARQAIRDQGWHGTGVWMIVNVHDELLFEVSNDLEPETVISVLRPAVEFPVEGWPPIRTDWEIGTKWGELREVA